MSHAIPRLFTAMDRIKFIALFEMLICDRYNRWFSGCFGATPVLQFDLKQKPVKLATELNRLCILELCDNLCFSLMLHSTEVGAHLVSQTRKAVQQF